MIKGIAFDLDGTLIDSTEAIVESFMHTFAELGEPLPTRASVVETISMPLEAQFAALTHRDPMECTTTYRPYYDVVSPGKTFLLPGVPESLERLRVGGLRLGVATSKSRPAAEKLLAHLGIAAHFEWCIGPEDVVVPKPHPDAVFKSRDRFGIQTSELLFIGDTAYDVNAAKAAGVRCLAVSTGYATRLALEALAPEAVFDSMEDATAYILDEIGTCSIPRV